MAASQEDVYILSAARTPVANINGSFASLSAHELGALVISEVLQRAKVEPAALSEVFMGQILTAGTRVRIATAQFILQTHYVYKTTKRAIYKPPS